MRLHPKIILQTRKKKRNYNIAACACKSRVCTQKPHGKVTDFCPNSGAFLWIVAACVSYSIPAGQPEHCRGNYLLNTQHTCKIRKVCHNRDPAMVYNLCCLYMMKNHWSCPFGTPSNFWIGFRAHTLGWVSPFPVKLLWTVSCCNFPSIWKENNPQQRKRRRDRQLALHTHIQNVAFAI